MPNGTYGGVRGRKTKVGGKLLRFPPTRLVIYGIKDKGQPQEIALKIGQLIGRPQGVSLRAMNNKEICVICGLKYSAPHGLFVTRS